MPDATENRSSNGLGEALVGELHLPEHVDSLPVMAVLKGSPAWDALRRMLRGPVRPGQIILVSEEELRSLREDVLVLTSAGEAPEGR